MSFRSEPQAICSIRIFGARRLAKASPFWFPPETPVQQAAISLPKAVPRCNPLDRASPSMASRPRLSMLPLVAPNSTTSRIRFNSGIQPLRRARLLQPRVTYRKEPTTTPAPILSSLLSFRFPAPPLLSKLAMTRLWSSQMGSYSVSGGSGGPSNCITDASGPLTCSGGYAKPSWQTGPGVPNDGARDLPDVSLFAGDGTISGSFYVVCNRDFQGITGSCNLSNGNFLQVGGTSVSTQVFAGIMALVDQKFQDKQGLINPSLYTLAKTAGNTCASAASPAGTCIFYDATAGTIAMPCSTTAPNPNCAANGFPINILPGYDAGAGYDLATGLGSVNAANLVNASSAWANTT